MNRSIVILGAGFGGLACAREISRRAGKEACKVTVVDHARYHVFTPLLYEVATGFIEHENLGTSRLLMSGVTVGNAELTARWGVDFIVDDVEGVDWERRRVKLRRGAAMPFDTLIIALGAEVNYYGIEGMAEHAMTLKNVRDADRLRQRIHDTLHKKERGLDDKLDIVIGGGGATGVELAAELTMFLKRHMLKGHLKPEDFSISIIEATPRVLGALPKELSGYAADRLRSLGIRLDLDTCVKKVERARVTIAPRPLKPGESNDALLCDFRGESEKQVEADAIVWTGGIRGSSALEKLGLPLDSRGKRLEVGPTLEVPGKKDVFAIGDAALLMDPATKLPVPWLAQAATAHGQVVAKTVISRLAGGSDAEYRFREYPVIVPLGGKCAIAKVGGLTLKGWLGWLLKEFANLRYFLSILPLRPAIVLWWRGAKMYSQND